MFATEAEFNWFDCVQHLENVQQGLKKVFIFSPLPDLDKPTCRRTFAAQIITSSLRQNP